MRTALKIGVLLAIAVISLGHSGGFSAAATSSSPDIDVLNTQIEQKKNKVGDLDALIQATRTNIKKRQGEEQTLKNEIAILENQVVEKQLAVERTQAEIEAIGLEIILTEKQVARHEERIQKQRTLIASLIRRMNMEDETSALDALLEDGTLSSAFARFEEVRRIGRDLESSMTRVKEEKSALEAQKQIQLAKQDDFEAARSQLKRDLLALEAEQNFKMSLIAETQSKEQEFQRILYELRQQQQSASSEIANLEERLKKQLQSIDDALARGDTILSWPADPSRGITAIFHDPTYPFRSVFEHPGQDIRVSVGTPIKAAAGGYVAWNKTGRMYGNYTMIVHAGGIATVYAHLSKFVAKPDTFVERGEVIGYSGGMPGAPGAGLSTGPHLHFEVRKDGIPVDPEHYLPTIPNSFYDYYDEYKALKIRL